MMHFKGNSYLLIFLCSITATSRAFLLPLLFPVSIKITIHSNHKPTHRPAHSYHFSTVPVYKEVVVKGSAHVTPTKHSYGDGQKYGTSYGDGHVKVYTNEPHIRGHKYATGYAGCDKNGCGGYAYVTAPNAHAHYKGTGYSDDPNSHYHGQTYDDSASKDTSYETDQGAHYGDLPHYKGTEYSDDQQYHKPTDYEEGHYKGTEYRAATPHPKGSNYGARVQKKGGTKHSYIKSVGGYKMSDFLGDKTPNYQQSGTGYTSHVAIPQVAPGKTYEEIATAHKELHSPKAYSAEEYEDLGTQSYKSDKEYEHDSKYLDDTIPYKPNIPRPDHRHHAYHSKGSPNRHDEYQNPTEPTSYGGFGTSIYGDSYAKIVYEPKTLRISIRAFSH